MKPAMLLSLAVLALPAFLSAQTADAHKVTGGSATSCPVSLQAKQGSGAGLVSVHKPEGKADNAPSILSNKPVHRIHLILGKGAPGEFSALEQIASATITAAGLSGRGRGMPLVLGASTSDIHRTLNVTFATEGDGSVYADLDLPGFTTVQSIRVDSITLKDGSTWSLDAARNCTVTPDPFMLIAQQ
ncbi:hypothetical protein DYQ86_23490 [Acidobacteria bacterium AB60]|nr:hypothetical protein DYQ86_23490 [Acidobacteria bacterium AB60]